MEGTLTSQEMWNSAAKGGLILGGATVLCTALSSAVGLLPQSGAGVFLGTVLGFALWVVKLVGCIWILYTLMKKFAEAWPSADRQTVRRFGFRVVLTSALIVSAYMLVYYLYIAPDTFEEAMTLLADNPMMDDNAREMLASMEGRMPVYSFFASLIWCILYVTVVSGILGSRLRPNDPFQNPDIQ